LLAHVVLSIEVLVMNPKVDAFLARADAWKEEMEKLRAIALDCDLTEELKWGKPCYSFQDSNVAIIQPFKNSCALMFFKGVLLKDPQSILTEVGKNAQSAKRICFTSVGEISRQEAALRSCIQEAKVLAEAGVEVEFKETEDYDVPEELTRKLEEDPELKAAFEALTPGRQRGYLLHFGSAKQSKTRESRIEKCREKIFAGKGYNER